MRLWGMVALMGCVLPIHASDILHEPGVTDAGSLLELPLEQLLHMEVSTASKFRQAAAEAPSAVTVISDSDIRFFGWRTLADILNSIRGLYVTDDRNYNYLGARGFARPGDYNTRFLLLIDGMRTNDALYDQATIGRDALIDVDLIERVEYVPGSGSSIYGANAFFGVINVITKPARQFGQPQVAVELGSYGERKLRATLGTRTEQGTQLLLSATAYRRDGTDQYYPEFDTPAMNNGIARRLDHEDNRSVYFKAVHEGLGLTVAHNERDRGVPTASFGQNFNDPRSETTDTLSTVELSYRAALGDMTDFTGRVFWGRQRYEGRYPYTNPDYVNLDNAQSAWIGSEFSVLNQSWAGHKILAGFEYQRDYKRDQFAEDEYPDGGGVQRISILNDKRSGYRAGLYLQDEITVTESVLLNLGGRYDYHDHEASMFNPRLALIYKLDDDTTVKGIYGTAFRAPNAFEMYYSIPGAGGTKSNPALMPEKIVSQELILEHKLSRNSRILGSVYENRVKDLISQTEDPSDDMLIYRNLSSAVARGLELQLESVSEKGVSLRASQSWQKTEDGETGARLQNSPATLTKINLSVPVWKRHATAGLEAHYVGQRLTRSAYIPGYWLANATLYSEKLFKKAQLSFSVFNLFDKHYRHPGSEEHAQDAIGQDGRTVLLKLTYTH